MPEVQEQTYQRTVSVLKAQQEASLDGILVVDENRKILSYNARFLELWDIPPALAQTLEDRALIDYVLEKLEQPGAFVEKVLYLYDHFDDVSQDEVRLLDGRILERYSAPVSGDDGTHYGRVWFFRDITERRHAQEALVKEKNRSEALLLNILPAVIADRLKEGAGIVADDFDEASVLFADIVGFTEFSNATPAHALVDLLNGIFTRFDTVAQRHGAEKIKTIGDAYMAVTGLPTMQTDHAHRLAAMALDMVAALDDFNGTTGQSFRIRIGMNTGPVVAGVIGTAKFIYDLWGDTVNLASRMESHGVPGCIQVTEQMYALLKDRFALTPRGPIKVKGLGMMETYILEGVL